MIELRDFAEADADSLYEWMRDPVSVHMAAFTAKDPDDRAAFDAWLARVRSNPTVIQKMIWVDGALVGSISTFEMEGEREVSYWIDRARSAPNLLPGWPVMGLEEKDFKILPKLSPEQEAEALRLATEGFQERIRNLTVA